MQQEATDAAVLNWAHRVQSDYNRKAPKNSSSKQKALRLKSLFWVSVVFLNYVKLMLPSWNIIFLFCQIPGQKMAQRDSAGLQDLFSLACFMTWLVPKMEVQLGAGSEVLSKIMETWELGCLGWCNVGEWITKKRNIPACVMLRCLSSVVFKFRTTFAL
jgi:hypothetical protein